MKQLGMTKVYLSIIIATVILAIGFPQAQAKDQTYEQSVQLAQAGSVGGRVGSGKRDLSGGASKKHKKTVTKQKKRRGLRRPLSGRWRMTSKCNTGKFVIILNMSQKSPTTFVGNTLTISGATKGTRNSIFKGQISGNRVTFSRGSTWTTRTTATLSANGRKLSGTERGPLWTCTMIARKQ